MRFFKEYFSGSETQNGTCDQAVGRGILDRCGLGLNALKRKKNERWLKLVFRVKGNKATNVPVLSNLTLLGLFLVLVGCNSNPIQPLEGVVSAANRQSTELPEKTKIDFLFVIDDSGSMGEEQENLARNFGTIAEFLQELGPSADYRVAVTSTNLGDQTGVNDQGDAGRFLVRPDPEDAPANCNQRLAEFGITEERPILSSENPSVNVLEAFTCMATLGRGGSGTERGLEAMRKALSCNHVNAPLFGECCVADPEDPTNRLERPTGVEGEACNSPAGCSGGLTCLPSGAGACVPQSHLDVNRLVRGMKRAQLVVSVNRSTTSAESGTVRYVNPWWSRCFCDQIAFWW